MRQDISRKLYCFAHLVNQEGKIIEGYDSEPKRAPTTSWKPTRTGVIPTAALIPLSTDITPGICRLEVGMYYLPTMQRLIIVNEAGQRMTDKIAIEPFCVMPFYGAKCPP
jgi:hypothetical protein